MTEIMKNAMQEFRIDKTNWTSNKFGDVAIQQKESVDRENTKLTKYIKGEHMKSEELHIRQWGDLKNEYLGPAFIRKFENGDILYGSRRTYLRKVAIAKFDGITSNTTFVIKANEEKIDKRLLPFLMLSEGFSEHSIRNSKGSVNPYVNWKDLANYEFLLPPKDQQARLAELLWAADEIIETNTKIRFKCESLLNSFSNHFFKNRDEQTISFKNIGEWKSGGTPSKKNLNYWNGDIPWISPKDMKTDLISDSQDKISELGAQEGSKMIPSNSLLIVVRGMILAHTFPVAITEKTVAFNQDIKALIPSGDFLPKILLYFLKKMSSIILTLSSESSHGTKSIPSDILFSLEIPLISKPKQIWFVNQIEAIERSKTESINHIESSKALQKSLINQIF